MGPRRGTLPQGAVGPPHRQHVAISSCAPRMIRRRSRVRNSLQATTLAPPLRPERAAHYAVPVSAPAQILSQRRWGVSDPAYASHTPPPGCPAGSLTPHVSVAMMCCGRGVWDQRVHPASALDSSGMPPAIGRRSDPVCPFGSPEDGVPVSPDGPMRLLGCCGTIGASTLCERAQSTGAIRRGRELLRRRSGFGLCRALGARQGSVR